MPPAAQVVGMAGNMLVGTSHGFLLLSAALPPTTQAAGIARSVLKGSTRASSSLLSLAQPPAVQAARIAGQVLTQHVSYPRCWWQRLHHRRLPYFQSQ